MKAALRQASVVDIHAHAVLRETLGAAGSYGPEIGATKSKGYGNHVGGRLDDRLCSDGRH